ncbi:MFS transporter [Kibdelosporangium philippinense]|uniref:MFS transporter n=1 Tax=Kibdelosporangium philippinense TaxID=211113 RepID=A0ABS8Z8D4_9PSEU|nr:MFS transporter [Kibdelosporangium philippinense]MCE7004155.1 MFS transporter [Kibdelosporangium philippinense]
MDTEQRRAAVALALIATSTLLSMSVWFSASFVVPQLRSLWDLSSGQSSLLTIAVQLGFVVGALTLAASGLADAVPGRVLMSVGAFGAAVVNLVLLWAPGFAVALALRALTGALLAAVYPPALKEVSSWYRSGRGTALGIMIGALTLGSAAPQLVKASGGLSWQVVIVSTTVLTALGGVIVMLVRGKGPYPFPRSVFSLRAALRAMRRRAVVLANVGYVGHMWELYAMWAWIGTFLSGLVPFTQTADGQRYAALAAFGCIAVGAAGCLVGGRISDRFGRAQAALVSLILSGGSAVTLAFVRDLPVPVVLVVCAFWGFWVIADSAQFSAMVTESADPRYVGSAVSLQLALGFTTTAVTIYLVPVLAEDVSWTVALLVLALGPAVGITALVAYLRRPAGTVP